ncbi:nicotinamide-nucleotide amidohydrolase family protein [Actinotalea sp. AC32]|nr:nicotinamide-nucleotide amidohydrolase family protein [Actinotalea sp. AC32]
MTSTTVAVPWDGRPLDPRVVVQALAAAGLTVAVAESLTGGAVCDALVGVAGASACLRGGVVAYATDVKDSVLGVDPALLSRHGAVHPAVAVQMADGVRRLLSADVGLATTGVAGPDPQDGKPPGTVHVALSGPAGTVVTTRPPGPPADRAAVRGDARAAALRLLLAASGAVVEGRPGGDPGGDG